MKILLVLVIVTQVGCASMAINIGSHIIGDFVSDKIKESNETKEEPSCGK